MLPLGWRQALETGAILRAAELEGHPPRAEDDGEPEGDEGERPLGYGPRGAGEPMMVGSFEKRRVLRDGAGLCSLGVWAPWHRPQPTAPRLLAIRAIVDWMIDELDKVHGVPPQVLFSRLAEKQVASDPVPVALQEAALRKAWLVYRDVDGGAEPRPHDRPQVIRIRLLEKLLRDGDDADQDGMRHFADGVRLGINWQLPRSPALYARKTRWRLPQQAQQRWGGGEGVEGAWRSNYKSVHQHVEQVEAQLIEHEANGWCLRNSPDEARRKFPGLTLLSLGAVAKDSESGGDPEIRLVMDGTHGVEVNSFIHVRDQDTCPTASDVKRAQREQHATRRGLGLALDVRGAHRLPPVHRDDWRHQSCRARDGGDIFTYTVGCFGVASIAYWWSRLGGALIRSVHLVADPKWELWLMLMADDLKLEATGTDPARHIVWTVLFLQLLGVPWAWNKTQGGHELNWIGYHVLVRELALGITLRRAQWAEAWLRRAARDGWTDVAEFRSCLGRLSFVAGALEYDKPFLAPLFAFSSRHPRGGLHKVPLYVRMVLEFLADRIARRRHYPSATRAHDAAEAFRVDAHAEGETVGVGGWCPRRNAEGHLDTRCSPWFAVSLSRATAPWAFHKGLPYRSIAALEALAATLGTIALSNTIPVLADAIAVIPGITDNRGNRYALTRLQSSRFPLSLLTMELAALLEKRRQRLALEWAPREYNREADRLASLNTEGFSPEHRIHFDLSTHKWEVLDKFWELAQEFERERVAPAAVRTAQRRGANPKRRKLKESDPW